MTDPMTGPVPDRRYRVGRDPVVLMYHGFCEHRRSDDPENLCVEQSAFEEQLTWLLAQNWRPLDLDGYLEWRRTGRRPASRSFLVTIDDGFRNIAEHAGPILSRLGVPAVLYVPSDLVGATATWLPEPADEPLLDIDELRGVLQDHPVELGLHGADHSDLRGLEAAELDRQVGRARERLELISGHPVRSYAYPFGAHDDAARAAVQQAGMEVAFAVFDDVDDFAIARVDVNATDSATSFHLKMTVPGYRAAWRMLQRAPAIRRTVRILTTRRGE